MIGIDTNILVRYLVQDDERQASVANTILDRVSDINPAFINNIVICETVWVLSRAYKFEKTLIVKTIEQILSTRGIEFENAEGIRKALRHYNSGNADFSDYLIAEINKENGAKTTYTFDRKAAGNSLFTTAS
ncbi:MAG: type II toxin-antitoxin system VapC family toxin [Victivallaceae bacterium]|nr:type II toxin-antitoxin system VapC family toxin [Victivallaceae bacterium]